MGIFELILLALITGYLLKKAATFLRRVTAGPLASVRKLQRPAGTVAAVVWCWLAPTTIMAIFLTLNGRPISHWERVFNSVVSNDSISRVSGVDQVLRAGPAERFDASDPANRPLNQGKIPRWRFGLLGHVSTSRVSGVNQELAAGPAEQFEGSDLVGNRPPWTEDKDKTTGDVRRIVVTSRLWSTEEEANEELRGRTAALVRSDFELRHHGLLDPEGVRFLSDDRAVEVAVKEKYVERFDQDFGKFTSPMNRVWWQVELSPVVRTEIYPAWKTAVLENRIIALGTILAIVTLLANEYALFARLKRTSNGHAARAALVTAGSLAVWIAADLFVATRLLS